MEKYNIKNMKGGWFIGNFIPSVYRTKQFEVCFKQHLKEDKWLTHYHKHCIEINYLIRGSMTVNNELLVKGDIFIFNKEEVCAPIFLTDCELIVIKTPSIPGDKHEVQE